MIHAGTRRGPSPRVASEVFPLWDVLYGAQAGYLALFAGLREVRPVDTPHSGAGRLRHNRQAFFRYPGGARQAAGWCQAHSSSGREAFYCVHLLTDKRRIKQNAAPVAALWAEADGGPDEDLSAAPPPTAIVESSPGRRHLFWRLMRPLAGPDAEALNRRIAHAVGADTSGWDLSQMSRPPGTRNRKYPDAPPVRLLFLDAAILYHPRELDLALPGMPAPIATSPEIALPAPPYGVAAHHPVDLERLSTKMQDLARFGNRGATDPYPTRSHADFAVAVAMFGKGFSEFEVASVLLDPSLGISEKTLEQGANAAHYLALTVARARAAANPAARVKANAKTSRRTPRQAQGHPQSHPRRRR